MPNYTFQPLFKVQDVNSPCRNAYRSRQIDDMACDGIFSFRVILDNLLEPSHVHLFLLVGAIQHHENGVPAVSTGIDITLRLVVRGVMDEFPLRHRLGGPAPIEKFAGKVPALILESIQT